MTSGANDQGIKRHIGKISEDEYNKLRSACDLIRNKAKK